MSQEEMLLLIVSFSLKMAGAVVALCILSLCALIGAKVCGINIKEAVDRVEKNPLAYSIFVVGHFIAASLVISSAW